ncbi:hypothetical protein CcarbDRAFT_4765 [Clostridium carboxidivorans P7]|uniref:Uncharacterized protein n=1 Tax=Clostridium carboxidivorans P7 TaxID=536227 RepID=C6Q148_9CLOT|nr:hypothetical protein [Clostridium carboxidivorans]EET84784.1 hypothetical protein CcarbDRAFT_4765 [Clostridium carboxidivorans P7]
MKEGNEKMIERTTNININKVKVNGDLYNLAIPKNINSFEELKDIINNRIDLLEKLVQ